MFILLSPFPLFFRAGSEIAGVRGLACCLRRDLAVPTEQPGLPLRSQPSDVLQQLCSTVFFPFGSVRQVQIFL